VGSLLETLPQGGRVVIIRLRSLGDCVLTTPAIQLLKRFRPDLEVSIVVEDRFRAIFEGNPDIARILPPEIGALRRARPQLLLNLHGGTRSAWMTRLSGARLRAGFRHFRWRAAYNRRIPRAQEILGVDRKVHTAEHLASAMFWLGVPLAEIPRARLVPHTSKPDTGRNACATIHPIAATAAKSWRAEGFLEVARYLRAGGAEVVFIGGPADDLSPFSDFPTLVGAPLAEIKSLLASAALFIGNDSGPAHMAAAFGVPSVVIFGGSDAAIWGPWRTPAEVISAPGGITDVHIDQVLAALTRLRVHA
jgi:ADP-heptose:LPS heptosyltransferase